jgi:hypothetical protein
LNTLGDEIARLTQQHQSRQKALENKIKELSGSQQPPSQPAASSNNTT